MSFYAVKVSSPLGHIMWQHEVTCRCYTDDTQIYVHSPPTVYLLLDISTFLAAMSEKHGVSRVWTLQKQILLVCFYHLIMVTIDTFTHVRR